MMVRIPSQISPNSTRFGVNMELSAKDARRVNNLGKNNVIYSSSRSVIFKNTSRYFNINSLFMFETYFRGRNPQKYVRNIFSGHAGRKSSLKKEVDSFKVEIKHIKRENYKINKRQKKLIKNVFI